MLHPMHWKFSSFKLQHKNCISHGKQFPMCYNFNNKGVNLKKALKDLDAEVSDDTLTLNGDISAFAKQPIPAIINYKGIVMLNAFWGTKEKPDAPTKGKNLKSENYHTFYKNIEKNRCLIPATSYFEHKTISVVGRKTKAKLKHELFWKNKEQFYIAALFDTYENGDLGFGLLTTLPNPIQAEIHNRMIITLDAKKGKEFLLQNPIEEFQFPEYSPNLEAINLEEIKKPNTLF